MNPSIVLTGFWGRGNAGDEAMLQVLYEYFSPHFEIIISVDLNGAYDGFWNWYPYSQARIIHQCDVAIIADENVRGVFTGGGGLPIGFGGAQKAVASALSKTTIISGIDDPTSFVRGPCFNKHFASKYLSSYTILTSRTKSAFDRLKTIVPRVQLGADWAWGLQPDQRDIPIEPYLCLVVREIPDCYCDSVLAEFYRLVLGSISNAGIEVIVIPFCPEDERHMKNFEIFSGLRSFVSWWNPRHLLQYISGSKGLFSIGRLHPLVFAAMSGVPALALDYDFRHIDPGFSPNPKIQDACLEFNIPYYAGSDLFIREFDMSSFLGKASEHGFDRSLYSDRYSSQARLVDASLGL